MSVSLKDLITADEKQMIFELCQEAYENSVMFLCSDKEIDPFDMDIDCFLEQWSVNKQELFKLFGNKLRVEQEIEIDLDEEVLSSRCSAVKKKDNISIFFEQLVNYIHENAIVYLTGEDANQQTLYFKAPNHIIFQIIIDEIANKKTDYVSFLQKLKEDLSYADLDAIVKIKTINLFLFSDNTNSEFKKAREKFKKIMTATESESTSPYWLKSSYTDRFFYDISYKPYIMNDNLEEMQEFIKKLKSLSKDQVEHIKIENGSKIMRIIKKCSEKFNLQSDFFKYESEISNIFREKFSKGTLCLSIHPLDFLTASMTNSNVDSCYNFIKGEVKGGAVEMMNSSQGFISFIKDTSTVKIVKQTPSEPALVWNKKLWRQFCFFYDNIGLISNKQYPFFNEELTFKTFELFERASAEYLSFQETSINRTETRPLEKVGAIMTLIAYPTYVVALQFGYDDFINFYEYSIKDRISDKKYIGSTPKGIFSYKKLLSRVREQPKVLLLSSSVTCFCCKEEINTQSFLLSEWSNAGHLYSNYSRVDERIWDSDLSIHTFAGHLLCERCEGLEDSI